LLIFIIKILLLILKTLITMGILNLFNTQGSQLQGQATATNSPTLVASTPQSKLHGTFEGTPGYSTNGEYFDEVNTQWQAYNDGMPNALPLPSQLDMNTNVPPAYEDIFDPASN
jgi:hypothetical protein